MKAIILSAGKGERLLPLTKDRPKICIDLGDGTTILSRQSETLLRQPDIHGVVVGAGHCVGKVEEFASSAGGAIDVIYNPFYAVSGPLVTLWVVLNRIYDAGFIFMNGDTFYSDAVYSKIEDLLSSSRDGIFLLCSHADEVEPDDIKVRFNQNNKVIEASKRLDHHNAISAGMMIVNGDLSNSIFRMALDRAARRDDFLNFKKTWHSFLKDLADEGVDIEPLMADKSAWAEVDIQSDLHKLQRFL